MPLDFPSSPAVGQQYLNWTWNGVAWVVTPGPPLASLAQSAQNAGRNYLDNALFNIQQRGVGPWNVTTSSGGQTYTADRWLAACATDTYTASVINLVDSDRAAIGDDAATSAAQLAFTGSSTAASYSLFLQKVEQVRRLSGKTVTVSVWARAVAGNPRIGFGWTQTFGTGGSPSAPVSGNFGVTAALTTTWQRYNFTGTLPSAAGKTTGSNGDHNTQFEFWLSDQGNFANRSGGIGVQSGTVQFWGMQVEVGTQATPLEKLVPEVDLARCQRFYQTDWIFYYGYQLAGGSFGIMAKLSPTMRAAPTLTPSSTFGWGNLSNTSLALLDTGSFYALGFATATGNCDMNGSYTASADL